MGHVGKKKNAVRDDLAGGFVFGAVDRKAGPLDISFCFIFVS